MEYSIQRLLPVIAKERKKHRKRKEILRDINAQLENGLIILQNSRVLLGENDPVFVRLESAVKALANAQRSIEAFIERGKIIEEF